MSLTLDDNTVQQVRTLLQEIQVALGGQPGTVTMSSGPTISWQQTLIDQARAWLSSDANVITGDPTGQSVIAAFRAAFPHLSVNGVSVVPVAPAVPGQPPTGQYRVALSVGIAQPPQPAPSPAPQTDATGGADGVGFAGANPPPGIDAATLAAAPAGTRITGSDGAVYVKAVQQEMMGYGVFWLKQ